MLMLLFFVSGERYVIIGDSIKKIMPKIKLKAVPQTQDYLSGLLNYGGIPVPVVDFCQLVEHRECEDCMHTRIILLNNVNEKGEFQIMGVIAEKVIKMIDLELDDFVESGVQLRNLSYIGGVYHDKDGIIRLILVDKLFDEMQNILFKEK